MSILVTGGAGFIGCNFIRDWLDGSAEQVINVDKLTYAGRPENLTMLAGDPRHVFVQGDITDSGLLRQLLTRYQVRAIINFAAESHVDRSINSPEDFIQTNILGVFCLLQAAHAYWSPLSGTSKARFRFLQVSTDEVYGALDSSEPPFRETSRYAPNSPYAASKAAGDHLVRAYCQTYGLPVLTTHCSNNYGPHHFPEKLIPLCILNALAGKPLPIYGNGLHVRDWLYVKDHCAALRRVLEAGAPGETYNIGGWNEQRNLDVVMGVCAHLDGLRPRPDKKSYATQIVFVQDRPGHDRRYAIDATKMEQELGWRPAETFESGLRKTVAWYLAHPDWVAGVARGAYRQWINEHYGGLQ